MRAAYRMSTLRLKELGTERAVQMTAEVLQNIQALGTGYVHQLSAMRAHDEAQIRLLLLVGPLPDRCAKN